MGHTESIIEEWRKAAGEEAYFSASRVQDRLFDLYGAIGTEPAREPAKRLVEAWLTLTIQRDLFSGAELREMLDEVEGRLTQGASAP